MKKTQTDRPAILPMAEIKQLDAGALTNLFVTSSNASRVAYLESAKALIALVAALGIEAAKTRLLQAGATEGLPSNVVPMQGPAASGAKTEATAPAKTKSKGVPMAEFAKLADTLEATALGIVSHASATPAELAVLVERVVNLARTVSEAAAQVQAPRVAVAA